MDGKDEAPSPVSTPLYRPSAEITPIEYEFYMRKAQEMRAEAAADFFRAAASAVRRLFTGMKPARAASRFW